MRAEVISTQRRPTRQGPQAGADEGLTLIEVVVALMIIAVVMAAAGQFFINSLRTTAGASSRQSSVNVVDRQLESIRAVPADQLLTGRTLSSVQTLLTWSGAAALTVNDDTSNTQATGRNYDASGATQPAVPTTTMQTVNNQVFTLYNFIDPCWLPVARSQSATVNNLACGATYSAPTAGSNTTMLLRVTVAAAWRGGQSTSCATGCTFAASTLVDPGKDALFQSNISQPTITGVSPNTIGAGATTTVTVSGAGFVAGATAATCANATVGTIDPATNTGVSIKVPITAGTTTGTCTLTITNPDGGNVTTTFQISQPPVVTSVSPSVQNYTTGIVTVTGANYGNPSVTPASGTWTTSGNPTATSITGSYAANAPSAGAVGFTLTNADGGQGSGSITVTRSTPAASGSATVQTGATISPVISVSDLAPSGVSVSANGGTATLTGQGGGTVNVSYTAPATAGSYTLTITNPDGGATTYPITVTAPPAPVITAVTDSTNKVCTAKNIFGICTASRYDVTYTATGTDFGSSPTVTLSYNGGAATTQVATGSATSQTFTVSYPANPAGKPYVIGVSTSSGSSTKAGTV